MDTPNVDSSIAIKSSNRERAREDIYPLPIQAWTTVVILVCLSILSFLDRQLLPLLSMPIASDLHLNDAQIGLLCGAAFGVFYAVGSLPLGWALDRWSRRWIIWAGVSLWSLATVACGFARNFTTLFAARAAVASGEVVLSPGSQSVLSDTFPPERLALPMAVFGLGSTIGSGASFMVGGALASLISVNAIYALPGVGPMKGWQVIFLTGGLLSLAVPFIMFLVPEPLRRRGLSHGATTFVEYFRFIARNLRFYLPHHAGIITSVGAASAINAWTPMFFARVHGWSTDQIGLWVGIAFAAGPLVAAAFHGAIVDRLYRNGRRDAHLYYLKIIFLVTAIPGAMVYLVPSPWTALGLLFLSQGLLAAYGGILPTALQLIVPANMRGKAASVGALMGGFGGMSLGPSLVAFFTQHVFHDAGKVGMSIATSMIVLMPLSAFLFRLAQKPMAQILAR